MPPNTAPPERENPPRRNATASRTHDGTNTNRHVAQKRRFRKPRLGFFEANAFEATRIFCRIPAVALPETETEAVADQLALARRLTDLRTWNWRTAAAQLPNFWHAAPMPFGGR